MKSIIFNNKKLFVSGNTRLLNQTMVSVAGSRKITTESSNWLIKAMKKLPKNQVVVSGLALGSDTIAHKTALELGLKTIAVLPSGFNKITPKSNIKLAKEIIKNDGLLISEYEPNQSAKRNTYIERNKIIADLCKYLIVPQCDRFSGTMHTINFLDKKKVIVTQDADYSGNQYIINKGDIRTIIF